MRAPPPATISPQAQALLRDATEITARSMEPAAIEVQRKAEAATEVNVCMIRYQDLLRVLEANPAISLRVIQALNRELQRSNDMIRNLGLMNSNERIDSLLLSLAPDESSPDTEIPLPLSRKDMAQMLGLTVETVSRVISQLMCDKVILAPAGKDYFRIIDRERLRTASGTEH